jgi:hypothetical protein
MLYGCGCGVVDKSNCLMRFFWLLLSTIKCNGVPFTHICEWKKHPPSSGSSGSSGWIVVVPIVALGFASTFCHLLFFSKSEPKLGLESVSLSSTTNHYFERHSSMFFQGILWKSHHFLVSFFIFSMAWTGCLEVDCSVS